MIRKFGILLTIILLGCISTHNRWTQIFKSKSNSIVEIKTTWTDPLTLKDNTFILGTGFIIEKNIIATAGHVVKSLINQTPGKKLTDPHILIWNGKRINLKVAYYDKNRDIGILITKNMGNCNKLKLRKELPEHGEEVFTIGHPRQIRYMSSMGVVNNITKRESKGILDMDIIHTSTRIEPGASGSPLMDINGKVIGIIIEIWPTKYGWYQTNVLPIKYIDKLLKQYKNDLKKKK